MKLADLACGAGEWLRGAGPMHDVVISSRVRLARNLAGVPFLAQCSPEQQHEVEQRLRREILAAEIAREVLYVDIAAASELDRQLLVERHLISRQHATASHPRGVAISSDETCAIMVNEEDHLRMQVLRSGLDLTDAAAGIMRVDDLLEARLDYAFHGKYGYLTACPTNVGTGLRVSVMLHLPALKMTGEIEKAFREWGEEVNVKYFSPSYSIRSVPANGDDRIFCADLGRHATHAAMAGKTRMLVGFWHGEFTHVPLKAIYGMKKRVKRDQSLWVSVLTSTGQPVDWW